MTLPAASTLALMLALCDKSSKHRSKDGIFIVQRNATDEIGRILAIG